MKTKVTMYLGWVVAIAEAVVNFLSTSTLF